MSLLDKLLCVTATVFILAGVVCLSVLEGERSNPNLPGLILLVLGIFTWLPLLITGFKVGGGGGGRQEIAGGTGKYAGITGSCEYFVDYLPDNKLVTRSTCQWQRN